MYVLVRINNYMEASWDAFFLQTVPIRHIEKGNKKQLYPRTIHICLEKFDNYVGVPWDESFSQAISITHIERGSKK